jgi:hypothetical protein
MMRPTGALREERSAANKIDAVFETQQLILACRVILMVVLRWV